MLYEVITLYVFVTAGSAVIDDIVVDKYRFSQLRIGVHQGIDTVFQHGDDFVAHGGKIVGDGGLMLEFGDIVDSLGDIHGNVTDSLHLVVNFDHGDQKASYNFV